MTAHATRRVTPLDATFLELEDADPVAHMHIGALLLFEPTRSDGPPRLATVRRKVEGRLDLLPRYRQRLSQQRTATLTRPEWEHDPGFDVCRHVHAAALPAPGGRRELLDWAGEFWSQRLDRRAPLWEVVLVEGLPGGRWALGAKVHHALVDGVGALETAALLLDPSRRAPSLAHAAAAVEEEHGRGAVRSLAASLAGGARHALAAAADPVQLFERSRGLVELLVRDELVGAPSTSLNRPIGTRRRFAAVVTDLAQVKHIKDQLGGTVNDVVLAAAAGGLRRLLRERGEPLPASGLRAMVPVNVRPPADGSALGNRITSLFVTLPVAEPEPLARYRTIRTGTESLKAGPQAAGGSTLVELAGLAPPAIHSVLARALFGPRLFNVTITNVPGPQRPLYAFGARMEEALPLVPLAADHAVGIAVLSYDGKLAFGLNGDDRAAGDLDVLAAGLEQSLAELRRLAAV